MHARSQSDVQSQRAKLANSYHQLLDEFSATDLQTVGNYTLGRLIGKGSFGKVYLATHKLTNGSKVVLKSAKKSDPNLAREIHHHRQFHHPHIARLYEVIVTEELVWLVLEYCPGDELYNHLLQNGRIEPAKAQKIFTQLLGAVAYVHSKSCVHRDLKLENILLDKYENVKLVDFGFTREYEGKASYLQTWCGTVCYSAPEMLKGEKYAGEKVDVWSLGIILYALLCGELPYDDDDESVTKTKILKEEPNYPDHLPPAAKDLIASMLSKRPLIRPALGDILKNPWLSDYAPQQQEILKIQQPAPFTTQLEKDTLSRLRSAGVNIDQIIENVLAQRCDALAGWWTLLMEKEERKEKKRLRRRKERDAEIRSMKRLSTASSRFVPPSLKEEDEEGQFSPPRDAGRARGRNPNRSSLMSLGQDLPELPAVPPVAENAASSPPPPIAKDPPRSQPLDVRPVPPPKEVTTPRGGTMLQVVAPNPTIIAPAEDEPKRRRKYPQPFLSQMLSIKHWFGRSTGRGRTGQTNQPSTGMMNRSPARMPVDPLRRRSTGPMNPQRRLSANMRPELQARQTYPTRPRVNTTSTTGSQKRVSLSPSPMGTPRSSFRRSSAGLRGRKSTSSSVSSVRSMHRSQHRHSASKASSTSSASLASPSIVSSTSKVARSPHTSVKVLPGTPTTSNFPSNIRVVRAPPASLPLPVFSESNSPFGAIAPGPMSPGLPVFAKRRRSLFKGPNLNLHSTFSSRSRGEGNNGSGGGTNSRSASAQGRRSGDAIQEEDEVEDEDDIEEVDHFTPMNPSEEGYIVEEGPDGLGPAPDATTVAAATTASTSTSTPAPKHIPLIPRSRLANPVNGPGAITTTMLTTGGRPSHDGTGDEFCLT